MIALKIGTTSWRQATELAGDEVEFIGQWIYGPDGLTDYMIWDAGLNNARAMTQGEIDAIPGQRAAQETATLVASVKGPGPVSEKDRAVVLVALDEFNLHALKINAILDAVDGAASLAALKTAVAAIADYPQRTKTQLLNAMENKINAGDTD